MLGGTAARAALPSGLRCLVADDMPMNRKLMRRALERFCGSGWTVTDASTAEKAVELACPPSGGSSPFDLIVTDEHFAPPSTMGVMRGSDAIRAILHHFKRDGVRAPATVLCTGNARDARAKQSEGAGGNVSAEELPDLVWDKPFPDPTDGSMAAQLATVLVPRAKVAAGE
jgi:CheY-like chemotaxis protein